jgi:general secretion pathway protein K
MTRATEPGSALLMAALTATLLAAAATIMLTEARSARAASGESLRLERARLAAQALLAEEIVALDANERTTFSGEVEDRDRGRVARQDASGLVDVNATDETALAALFIGLGAEQETGAVLASRVADWRDEDDLVRVNGAERDDYESAGLPAPANRNFVVETEIASVLGFSSALAACLAPYLTTHSGLSSVDSAAAPAHIRNVLALDGTGSPGASFAPFGHVIVFTADAPISDAAMLRISAWVRLTGDPRQPFIVHRSAEEFVAAATAPQVRCFAAAEARP